MPGQYGFIFRYGTSGLVGATIQTLVLYAWVSLLGFKSTYLWGVALGLGLATTCNFLLQKYWTFSYRLQHHPPRHQYALYLLLALVGLACNSLLLEIARRIFLAAGIDFFRIWYLVAEVVVIAIVAVLSFLVNFFIIFRARNPGDESS